MRDRIGFILLLLFLLVLAGGCAELAAHQPPTNAADLTVAVIRLEPTVTPPLTTPAPPTPSPTSTATELPPTPTAEPEITLAAVGDIMLARSIGRVLRRNPEDSPFSAVAPLLRQADVTVGNLECALGTGGRPASKSYTFLGPPAAAASLADAGFDVVSLANNHSLDFGPEVLSETITLLDQAGILHPGAGRSEAEAHRPAVIEARGLRLAFLAYVNVPVEVGGFNTATWRAIGDKPGVAWAKPDRVAADVQAARGRADLVIVLLHPGLHDVQGRQRL